MANQSQVEQPVASAERAARPQQHTGSDQIDFAAEIQRIRHVYAKRKRNNADRVYSRSVPYHAFAVAERNRVLAELIRSLEMNSVANLNVLEVGCGNGATLRHIVEYGTEPKRLFGIDLLPETLQEAKRRSPAFQFLCGNAGQLPFSDGSFGLVLAFTLFTSVLGWKIKAAIAAELMRVLHSRGRVIWYDFAYNNPGNSDVRGIGRREIGRLFPSCRIVFRRVTLAPPIGRLVTSLSPLLFRFLSGLKIFSTHYLCVIEKAA